MGFSHTVSIDILTFLSGSDEEVFLCPLEM
jgi:hypothetical protein